jgi:glyoxylase-like metal-dependent hydrolase (beta-lactamase superfamily II)
MKIIRLRGNERSYTCNSYLVLGTWNRIEDVNSLVDIGTDSSIIHSIEMLSTGVGKIPVEKVVLTHSHFDHMGGLMAFKKKYNSEIYAFTRFEGVDRLLQDGQIIRLGDRNFEVIHTPGHSDDSICLYCADDGVLFSGDTPLKIRTREDGYSAVFEQSLEKIAHLEVAVIYSGHDDPIHNNISEMLKTTIQNVRACDTTSHSVVKG